MSVLIAIVVLLTFVEQHINAMTDDPLSLLYLFEGDSLLLVNLLKHFFRGHAQILLNTLFALAKKLLHTIKLHCRLAFTGRKPCKWRLPVNICSTKASIVKLLIKQRCLHHIFTAIVLECHLAERLLLLPLFPRVPLELFPLSRPTIVL